MLPQVRGNPCTAAAGGLEARSRQILLYCSEDGERERPFGVFLGQFKMILIVTVSLYLWFSFVFFVHVFTSLFRFNGISSQCGLLTRILSLSPLSGLFFNDNNYVVIHEGMKF